MKSILVTLHSEPPIKLEVIVDQHSIASPDHIDKTDRFRQGSATVDDLFADLDIPNRRETQWPTGAHTPGIGAIHLRKKYWPGFVRGCDSFLERQHRRVVCP